MNHRGGLRRGRTGHLHIALIEEGCKLLGVPRLGLPAILHTASGEILRLLWRCVAILLEKSKIQHGPFPKDRGFSSIEEELCSIADAKHP